MGIVKVTSQLAKPEVDVTLVLTVTQVYVFVNLRRKTLNPELFLYETSFSLYMPLTHPISISVQALTPKLNLTPRFRVRVWFRETLLCLILERVLVAH